MIFYKHTFEILRLTDFFRSKPFIAEISIKFKTPFMTYSILRGKLEIKYTAIVREMSFPGILKNISTVQLLFINLYLCINFSIIFYSLYDCKFILFYF